MLFIKLKLHVFVIFLFTIPSFSFGQCYDVYKNSVKCAGVEDSMLLYKNALTVYNYYENNPFYQKINSYEILNDVDRINIFEKLKDARKTFFDIRREVSKIKGNSKRLPKLSDISFGQYYQKINNYRFYQRELENQIVNLGAPITLYDIRIAPVVVNEYKCLDSGSAHLGDIVNIPIYIPVTVKPVSMLSAEEKELRNKILHLKTEEPITASNQSSINITDNIIGGNQHENYDGQQQFASRSQSSTNTNDQNIVLDGFGVPVYYRNQYGGASIIGFMNNRKFKRIRPVQYKEYVVPKIVQELLENDDRLNTWFKINYGDYFLAIY
jgi:hypothetical protein